MEAAAPEMKGAQARAESGANPVGTLIFVTVGSLFRFDRLVTAMDEWAAGQGAAAPEILCQIGTGAAKPRHMAWVERLDRAAFEAAVARARLVVAHAGVGSVVTAARFGRPAVVMPRRRHLGEHTSDHQVETAAWLRAKPGVWVADDERALGPALAAALAADPAALGTIPPHAPSDFLRRLGRFLRA